MRSLRTGLCHTPLGLPRTYYDVTDKEGLTLFVTEKEKKWREMVAVMRGKEREREKIEKGKERRRKGMFVPGNWH